MRLFSSTALASAAALLSLVAVTASGCAVDDPATSPLESPEGPAAEAESPIFGGTVDTTHDAVVLLETQGGYVCTATIIEKSGSTGWALTAAHCVDDKPVYLYEGDDIVQGKVTAQYPITAYKADPGYAQSGGANHDFAMVRFTGAGPNTKVIPVLTPAEDTLKVGTSVVNIGYGRTENNNNNTKRLKVTNKLSKTSALTVEYGQANGGTCQGDSGGPGLVTAGGGERVAIITSYGDQDCVQFGVAGRASAVYSSFIRPFIDGTTGGTVTCEACFEGSTTGQGSCSGTVNACFNDTQCSAFYECYSNCTTAACDENCANQYPTGFDKFLGIYECVCTTGCKAECGNEPTCEGIGTGGAQCGFAFQDPPGYPSCSSCITDKCCAQTGACAADAACDACFMSENPPASCDTNALANGVFSCVESACGVECGLVEPGSATTSTGSSTASVSPGATSSTSDGATTGATTSATTAAGVGGSGSSGGDEGGTDEPKSGGESTTTTTCSCVVAGKPSGGQAPVAAWGLALAGLAAVAARRGGAKKK